MPLRAQDRPRPPRRLKPMSRSLPPCRNRLWLDHRVAAVSREIDSFEPASKHRWNLGCDLTPSPADGSTVRTAATTTGI